jgi:hypothetical protein
MLFIFSTPVLVRHLWQLKTVVFLHWCLICAALLGLNEDDSIRSSRIQIYYNTEHRIYTLFYCVMASCQGKSGHFTLKWARKMKYHFNEITLVKSNCASWDWSQFSLRPTCWAFKSDLCNTPKFDEMHS